MEQDTIIMQDIFLFMQDGIDENGRAFGHFEVDRRAARRSCTAWNRPACGCRPTCSPPASGRLRTGTDGE